MISLQIRQPHHSFFTSRITPLPPSFLSPPSLLSLPLPPLRHRTGFYAEPNRLYSSLPQIPCYSSRPIFRLTRVLEIEPSVFHNAEEKEDESTEDLSPRGRVYRKTLALVECSMFAALTGLVYFLSNFLAIENYFGCFFSLPIVISSMRWGIPAGRKTMVATTMLLLVWSSESVNISGSSSGCCRVWLDIFIPDKREHTCPDHHKHAYFSNILVHCIRSLCNTLNGNDLYNIRGSGFTKLWILCLLVAPVAFGVSYKAWDEIFIENAKMAGESYIVAA